MTDDIAGRRPADDSPPMAMMTRNNAHNFVIAASIRGGVTES